jgi:Ca2+-binding RTX toxin-like protein
LSPASTLLSVSLDTAAHTNIERLIYSGTGAFTGTGNALSNFFLGGTGQDTFYRLGGNDEFRTQNGADTMTGGGGADQFVVLAAANSKPDGMDHILDFTSSDGDKIVVTSIDVDTATSTNDAFVLDTDSSFSAGEIEKRVDGNNLILKFNVDSDPTVEMAIVLEGRTALLSASHLSP